MLFLSSQEANAAAGISARDICLAAMDVVGVRVRLSLVQGWVEKARKGVDQENKAMQEY